MSHHHEASGAEGEAPRRCHHRSRAERDDHGTRATHGGHGHAHNRRRGPRVETEQTLAAAQVADHLEALSRAVRAGAITVRVGDRAVGMRLADDVGFKLRAGQRGGRGVRISLRMAWTGEKRGEAGAEIDILPGAMAEPESDGNVGTAADAEDSRAEAAGGEDAGREGSVGAPTEGGVPEERAGAPRALDTEASGGDQVE